MLFWRLFFNCIVHIKRGPVAKGVLRPVARERETRLRCWAQARFWGISKTSTPLDWGSSHCSAFHYVLESWEMFEQRYAISPLGNPSSGSIHSFLAPPTGNRVDPSIGWPTEDCWEIRNGANCSQTSGLGLNGISLYRKSSDRVAIGYSDTFSVSQHCHWNQSSLCTSYRILWLPRDKSKGDNSH